MVRDYLSHKQVLLKKSAGESFSDALQVFVRHAQEPVQSIQQSSTDLTYESLQRTFYDAREQFTQCKAEKEQLRLRNKGCKTFLFSTLWKFGCIDSKSSFLYPAFITVNPLVRVTGTAQSTSLLRVIVRTSPGTHGTLTGSESDVLNTSCRRAGHDMS